MDDKSKKIDKTAINVNLNLSTPWIDSLNFSKRTDDICLLRFITSLPEGQYEQSRVFTSKSHLIKFIDLICSALDYYPIKNEKKLKQ